MKFDITLKQYEDIYKIVASVGKHFSHGAGRSCQFYNVNGAYLLQEVLKIKARPIMGAALFMLTENKDVLSFAGEEDNNFFSSPEAFHCWVETENNYIDFTAPEYREAAMEIKEKGNIPRKMFQKPKGSASENPYVLNNPGDFFLSENKELTASLLSKMASIPATQDFAYICCEWYKKLNKKKLQSFQIIDDLGEKTLINLKSSSIQGKW